MLLQKHDTGQFTVKNKKPPPNLLAFLRGKSWRNPVDRWCWFCQQWSLHDFLSFRKKHHYKVGSGIGVVSAGVAFVHLKPVLKQNGGYSPCVSVLSDLFVFTYF